MSQYTPTERTRVRRLPKRAEYDRDAIHAILDEALVCHLSCSVDGMPLLQPTLHWREGNQLYVHGSSKNGLFRALLEGAEACIAVTLIDGVVFARSAFHHSINYRSVILYAKARAVEDAAEKTRILERLLEKFQPGRAQQVSPPNAIELKATGVWAGVQHLWLRKGEVEYDPHAVRQTE